jgi:hypothetical protein
MSNGVKNFLTGEKLNEESKDEFINNLIVAKNYELAHLIWQSKYSIKSARFDAKDNFIFNGDFENEINLDEVGFNWKFNKEKRLSFN